VDERMNRRPNERKLKRRKRIAISMMGS